MGNLRQKLQMMLLVLTLGVATAAAQNIRYVSYLATDNTKDGTSWTNAKKDIQDAINDLVNNNLSGEVWVQGSDDPEHPAYYYPTESTESSGSQYYKAFKIPAGITVRGGFSGEETYSSDPKEALAARVTVADKNFGSANSTSKTDGTLDGEEAKSGVYKYKTVLCGDLVPSKQAKLEWNPTKQQFDVTFYGNSYHVVWFAMNGFTGGRANPLAKPAKLEGCVVEGGHAYSRNTSDAHPHEGYGGGIYMVANSFVYNCEVRNCDASHNGGGIYMDGGGIVRRTYVHDCQALGVGTEYGMGGGICEDGGRLTSKTNPIVVAQSVVTNCVGRMGGGMALDASQTVGNNKFAVVVNSTLINNNTAQVEAGGVYTYKGCGVSSSTIVRNRCNGSGITQSGQMTGRSGGLYCRDAALVGNTVIWGNEVEANNNIQYADSRSSLQDSEKTHFYYNALSNAEIVDWSKAEKLNVLSLDSLNSTTEAAKGKKGYPLFENPTLSAGYLADNDRSIVDVLFEALQNATDAHDDDAITAAKQDIKDRYGDILDKETDDDIKNLVDAVRAKTAIKGEVDIKREYYNWKVFSESALHHAGINTVDLDYDGLTPAPTGISWDMQFGEFNSRCTMGAIISEEPEINANIDRFGGEAHFFVDPDYNFATHHEQEVKGTSWTLPTRFLGNVFEYINEDRKPTGNHDFDGLHIFIHVKQGTVDNTDSYKAGRVRTTSLEVPSNVTLLGSYDATLTGTDLSRRNVVRTPTVISGKLLDDYKYNIAHLITLDDDVNVTIDGFKISYANAESTELANDNKNGAAITIKNSNNEIKFKNIIVNNSLAEMGAAIYADNSSAEFENCIFHNNTTTQINNSGIIYATNGSRLTFNHCDVLRNVGHASYLGTNSTTNVWHNSIFYGNLDRAKNDTNTDRDSQVSDEQKGRNKYALAAFSGNTGNASGDHCMFDYMSSQFASGFNNNDTGNRWQYDLQYAFVDGTGQGYPRFINPTKNAGYSEDGDVTYYGRATSFEPHNNNPVVNTASHDGDHSTWGKDITTLITRDYGGLPDIGAMESHMATDEDMAHGNGNPDGQLPYGAVLYVRDYKPATGTQMDTYDYNSGTDTYEKNVSGLGLYNSDHEFLDGSSWARAINGNGTYTLSGTRKHKDSHIVSINHCYRINSGVQYLDVRNETLNRYGDKDTCTVFMFLDANKQELAAGDNVTTAKYLKDRSTGEYLYLDYTNKVYTFRTSPTPPVGQDVVTITSPSSGNYVFCFTANKQNRYIRNNDNMASTGSSYWKLTVVPVTEDRGTGDITDVPYNLGDFNGLQYAVNKSNIAFEDGVLVSGGDIHNSKKQVWVGAGVYSSDPKTRTTPLSGDKSEKDPEAENCYVIQDGVDVYGAFPKEGTPGMNERQALVSQYVHVLDERGCTAVDYETILEPATKGVTVDVTRRVLGQTWDYNPKKTGYKIFYGAKWDGFTLRDGVLDAAKISYPNRHGGAGAAIYNNVTLKNVVVTNNTTIYKSAGTQQDFRAGGIYCDGGTLDAGYVINNKLESYNASERVKTTGAAYGGGMYIYRGTVFNSVIARNSIYAAYADGAGTFIEDANFFNNTIVYNNAEGTNRMCGGVAIWNDAASRGTNSELNVYNCIIAKNDGTKLGKIGNANMSIQSGGVMNINYCITEDTHTSYITGDNKNKIVFSNCQEVTGDYSNIFVTPSTTGSENFNDLNLRLLSTASNAINQGNDAPVIHGAVYNLTDYNDMDFDERIQDCRIDIGAYEFNGATIIEPHKLQADGTDASDFSSAKQLVFYVTPDGYGTTNAHDPENAACAQKLQRVIDAAGRYKIQYPNKQVIVKVANSYDLLHPNNGVLTPGQDGYTEPENFTYYATRTTDAGDQNVRVWSIMVPRGVEVWGGYTDVARTNQTKASWTNSNNGFMDESGKDARNITKNPTYFDSYYYNKDQRSNALTYHVVTFTDRVFDIHGVPFLKTDVCNVDGSGKVIYVAGKPQFKSPLDWSTALSSAPETVSDESLYLHMSDIIGTANVMAEKIDGKAVSNRAVLDGIFITGGNADGKAIAGSSMINAHSYGGAAIVTEYAYVRNCIVMNNSATNGGGLALTHGALVSGSLIMQNNADNQGGGLYVFENGAKLSNGTTVNTTAGTGQQMDINMPHVFTSTIVRNTAQQGGGIWYSNTNYEAANARFNSVAVWQNSAQDQDNVYGMVNPEQPTEDETDSEIYYPFSYSLIQDMRASGTNNLSAMAYNHEGVRFVNKTSDYGQNTVDLYDMAVEGTGDDVYENFGYYGLTHYSTLCSNGMPNEFYNKLKKAFAIADVDILGQPRVDNINNFVEIGARALPKRMPNKQLMLRIFVAHPEYVDTRTATRFMRLKEGVEPGDKSSNDHKTWEAKRYYSQVGSSFAYPFNFLQDALDYITHARNGQITGLKLSDGSSATSDIVRNLPFEIVLGKGTYYPRQSLNGATESVWAHTFAIPEGVTIIGGFNPKGGNGTYYGRYYKKGTIGAGETGDIYTYVTPIPTDIPAHKRIPGGNEIGRGNLFDTETVTLPRITGEDSDPVITFQQWHIQDIADRRAMYDNNKNGIVEPWEFLHPTTISGNAVNGETDGVYHIMTAVADEDAVGRMPKVKRYNKDEHDQWLFTGIDNGTGEGNPSLETGYQWKEEGQQIRLNGLIITGGNALTYLSTALDDYGSYIFYQGAGLQVDGNRYKNNKNNGLTGKAVFHNSAAYGVGYRDIPVSVTNCQFLNNVAGYGGAISTNGSLSLFASSFEQNLAIAATEKPEDGETWKSWVNDQEHTGEGRVVEKVMYPGQGGAILATGQLSAFNTLFANNEARYEDEYEPATITPVVHPTFRVPGGGTNSLRAAGGAIMMGSAGNHHIVNCDFVRNKANAYPAVFTMNPTYQQNPTVDTHDYSQIINTVAWGNEVNPDMLARFAGNTEYKTASKLMVNIGRKDRRPQYITTKDGTGMYVAQFVNGSVPTTLDVDNPEAAGCPWQEAVWFCAYEEGVGFKPNNTNDLREAIVYNPKQYAPTMIENANGGNYQNCNMLIVADNNDVAGPNFGNPSVKAGFDGFMEGADWSPARFNRLTDNGNGWIRQDVAIDNVNKDFVVTFHNDEGQTSVVDEQTVKNYQGAYPVTHYISELPGAGGVFPEYKLWLALGREKYMQATNQTDGAKTINGVSIGTPNKNYPRISPDPTMGVTKAYIDIGVYEYQKQPLLKPGSEVDILWVSTKEKPENGAADGLTWRTPTSDLQKAIETLLQSRNGHKKEIRIMEGEYAPVTPKTIDGGSTKYNAFVIDTKSLNASVITPTGPTGFNDGHNNGEYYAQSITIKGGYSQDIMYEYDPVQYKTVIRQNEAAADVNKDYLIYIADPTVRYAGKIGVSNDNATWGTDGSKECYTARTMPIQIDGVTLINDQATANKQGSAIYYPDVTPTATHSIRVNSEVTYYTTDSGGNKHKSNVETEDLTTKIYYTDAGKTVRSTDNLPTEYYTESGEQMTNPAKLVITKTQVVGSGKSGDANNGSAVYIGQNGGSALIYNTVFHSNYGMPLNAYNTINVNNTFGLNAGRVQLNGTSEMHNSALWRNNWNAGESKYDDQFTGATSFTFNSYTGCTTDANNNTSLSDVNSNIGEGPNFVDPENAEIESRSFDLKPSMRLLNKGNLTDATGTYYTKIMHYDLGASKYADYDYALIPTTGVDVLNRPRFKNNIDLGAYEFQGSLYNILYVDPNKSHSDAATGENWDKAFGYGDMQNAIDLAAIYHATNTDKEAYVFVKGASSTNKNLNTNETLIIRDGVTTYGSIISSYTDWHGIEDAPDHQKYADVAAYIKDMTSIREGIASDAASKTIVTGIKVENGASISGGKSFPALVDGFVVTNPTATTTPVLDITNSTPNAAIVVRNVVVADNNVTGGADVARINNGLLYEALLRDNKAKGDGATLRVSKGTNYAGYAVNVTVEGTTIDANGETPAADTDGNNIYNSIINSIDKTGTKGAYGNITNKHISGYFYNIADPNLNYQLTETSKYIDMCDGTVNPLSTEAPNLAEFINYDTDRDLLGNPRLLVGVTDGKEVTVNAETKTYYLDRGAFETWKVKNTGNNFFCGDAGTINTIEPYKTNADDKYSIIKKHFYPHDGSVCYIMEGQSLIIDAFDPAHEVKPTPHNPGFMLVQEGANFYGNGRPATCAYLAIERKVRKTTGSIVSIPYAMQYNENVSKPIYTAGVLTQLDSNIGGGAWEYNGEKRSEWNHIFHTTNSDCWNSIANSAVTTANHGVLYQAKDNAFDGDNTEVTLRFTGKGTSLTDYVYTETTDVYKNVTLTKHDDAESTNGAADFTDNLDMGWNCIGLPWLVSSYQPQHEITAAENTNKYKGLATTGHYMMQIPHTMWLYFDGVKCADGTTNVNGDGGYYSVNSWEGAGGSFDKKTNNPWHVTSADEERIWMGEGIFMQTASFTGDEQLTFYRPIAPDMGVSGHSKSLKRYRAEEMTGVMEQEMQEPQGEVLETQFFTVDGKRIRMSREEIMRDGSMEGVIIERLRYSNGVVTTRRFHNHK